MKWPRSKLRGVFWMRPEGQKNPGPYRAPDRYQSVSYKNPAGSASGSAVGVGVDLVDLGRC